MPPIRYSDEIETLQPDEPKLVEEIVTQMRATQAENAERHRHAHRDAHAKSHTILKGRMRVHDDLAPELSQGIFVPGAEYEVVARLSSAPGDIHSDEIPAPRGFALKVIGVPGERLTPALGGANQDFLMVNFPVLAFGTVQKYKKMLALLEKNANAPDALQKLVAAAARGAEDMVEALGGKPGATLLGLARDNANILGETFHTQAALRYGDHVAKLSIAPEGGVVDLTDAKVESGFSAMRDAVGAYLAENDATYTLRAQLCTNLEQMPVEDAAVEWDADASPHRPVASLHFPAQDAYSPARQVHGDDHLAFNPWNGVAAHRPLGSIMRVRKAAYESSSEQRHRLNNLPRQEPRALTDVPD